MRQTNCVSDEDQADHREQDREVQQIDAERQAPELAACLSLQQGLHR